MRDILFRGLTKTKTWIEGWFCGGTCDSPDGDVKQCFVIIDKNTLFWFDVDPDTIGQYTGVVDRKGQKIFEGDIVRNVNNGKTAIVKWYEEHAAFMLYCHSENKVYWFWDNDFDVIEVIGDAHRNPELLEGGARND